MLRFAIKAAFVGGLLFTTSSHIAGGPALAAEAQEPEVLTAITWGPRTDFWMEPMYEFIERVNERLDGRLSIRHLGQADVVPPFEQFEAVHNGVVDVILGVTSWYTGQIPEANTVLYSQLTPRQLRDSGYYDYMRELHRERANVVYLANVGGEVGRAYRMYTNVDLTEPDFTGLRFRVTAVYAPLVHAFGGTTVVMPPADIYSAMERGVIDGYGWTYGGTSPYGWPEVTNYAIEPGFYTANINILIHGDSWERLPEDMRTELEEIGRDLEEWSEDWMRENNSADNQRLEEAGVQFIDFGDEFAEMAYKAAWEEFAAEHGEELAEHIRSMLE